MSKSGPDARGWQTVVGSGLALIVCNGPVIGFTFGVFLKPVSQEFGWHRAGVSAASGMASFMFAIGAPLAGRLFDRFGVRRVLLPTIVMSSLAVAAISLSGASVWAFIALYTLAGAASAAHGPQPYVKAIVAWFDSGRGLALGIAMAGVGIGIVLVPQLARALIEHRGWRSAYVGLGLTVAAVALPAVALLVHEPPPKRALCAAEQLPGAYSAGAIRSVLFHSYRFRILAASTMLVAMALNGTTDHLVPLLTDRGISAASAGLALGTVGLASIAGRLLGGYLADRLAAPRVAAGFFLVSAVGILLMLARTSLASSLVGELSIGLALGCEIDMMGLLITRYFGIQFLGQLYGYLFAVFAAGAALGKYLMGLCFDTFHSYRPMLAAFVVALSIASALVARLGGYVFTPYDAPAPLRQHCKRASSTETDRNYG
jgi:MFS family permease